MSLANVLCMDFDSDRCVHSTNVLRDHGFHVRQVQPIPMEDGLESNFHTFVSVLEEAARRENWTYVFEDDISASEPKVTHEALIAHEKESDHEVVMLGACAAEPTDEKHITGLCAHAWGVSPQGAQKFLEFARRRPAKEFDVNMSMFCRESKTCTLVFGDRVSSQNHEHIGYFYQDRARFPSTLS